MDSRSVVEIGQDIATILTDSPSKPADNSEPIDVNLVDLDDDGSSIEALPWSDFDDDELEQARLNVPSDKASVKDENAKNSGDAVENGDPEDDLQASTTSTVNENEEFVEQPEILEENQEGVATEEDIDETTCDADASVESTEVEETELLDNLDDGDKIYRFEKNQGFNEKLTFGVILTVVLAVGIGIGNFVAYTEYEDMIQVPESIKSSAYGSQSGINSSAKQPLTESTQYRSLECLVTGGEAALAQHIQLLKSCNATLGHVVEQLDSLQHRIDSLGTNRAHLWFPFSIFGTHEKTLSVRSKQSHQPKISEPVEAAAISSPPVEDSEEVTLTEAPFEDIKKMEPVLGHSQKSAEAVYGAVSFEAAVASAEAPATKSHVSKVDPKLTAASPVMSTPEVANEAQREKLQKKEKSKAQIFQNIPAEDYLPKEAKKVLKKQKNFDKNKKSKHQSEKQDHKKKQKYLPANDELIQPCYKTQKSKDNACGPPEAKLKKKKTKVENDNKKPQAAEFDWHIYRAKTREHRRMQNFWETEFKQQQNNWQLDRARSREMQRKQLNDAKKFKKMSKKAYYKSRD